MISSAPGIHLAALLSTGQIVAAKSESLVSQSLMRGSEMWDAVLKDKHALSRYRAANKGIRVALEALGVVVASRAMNVMTLAVRPFLTSKLVELR